MDKENRRDIRYIGRKLTEARGNKPFGFLRDVAESSLWRKEPRDPESITPKQRELIARYRRELEAELAKRPQDRIKIRALTELIVQLTSKH